MKDITPKLKEAIESQTMNLARCWKLTLKNGEVLAFTTADKVFEFGGVAFNCVSANDVDKIINNPDVKSDTLEISNIISSDIIDANDILAGKYDGAKVEVFIVDLSNLDGGKVSLLNGRISDIEYNDNLFVAKVKGLKDEIDRILGEVYTPLCRTLFCDGRCKLKSEIYTFHGTIVNVIDDSSFSTESTAVLGKSNGYFDNGVMEFTDGKNIGQKTEIKQHAGGMFILASEPPYRMAVGDGFRVIAGCDKQFSTCCEKFDNSINFRGEPHLPGIELLLKVM